MLNFLVLKFKNYQELKCNHYIGSCIMLSLLEIEKLMILINQLVTISKFLVHEKASGTSSPNLSQLPN